MPQTNRVQTDILTVSLPKSLKREIVQYAKKKDQSVSQFIKDASRNYILEEELGRLQKVFGPALKKLGIKTYDDVEKYFG